jgi:hypothetical protein
MTDTRSERKDYSKPDVVEQRDIEALTTVCETGGNTMQDKLSFDANTGTCLNPLT